MSSRRTNQEQEQKKRTRTRTTTGDGGGEKRRRRGGDAESGERAGTEGEGDAPSLNTHHRSDRPPAGGIRQWSHRGGMGVTHSMLLPAKTHTILRLNPESPEYTTRPQGVSWVSLWRIRATVRSDCRPWLLMAAVGRVGKTQGETRDTRVHSAVLLSVPPPPCPRCGCDAPFEGLGFVVFAFPASLRRSPKNISGRPPAK